MYGNIVFSRDSIFPTPQQSGCLLVYLFPIIMYSITSCDNSDILINVLQTLRESDYKSIVIGTRLQHD